MDFFILLLFCLAMSLDSVMVGISYGISGISLPVSSMVVVSIISGAVLLASMSLGRILGEIIPVGMVAVKCRADRGQVRVISVIRGLWVAGNRRVVLNPFFPRKRCWIRKAPNIGMLEKQIRRLLAGGRLFRGRIGFVRHAIV